MKIQLMSDLHLEFYRNGRYIPPIFKNEGADVLVLAGDINVGIANTANSIIDLAKDFEHTIYVAGNHEHYVGKATIGSFHHFLKEYLLDYDNIHVLNCSERVKIQDVTFFGGTLWTNFRDSARAMENARIGIQDFRAINDFSPLSAAYEFQRQFEYIKDSYEAVEGKKVIVTHFLPAVECISERFRDRDGFTNELNKYFANDLGDWIETLTNVTWLHGHTHDAVDVKVGSTRVLARPMGYPGEFGSENVYAPLILEV